jgi:hypothetical protein
MVSFGLKLIFKQITYKKGVNIMANERTRGRKNDRQIKKEDPSVKEALNEVRENYELTGESLLLNEKYNKNLLLLKEYNDNINKFFNEYGQKIDLAALSENIKYKGYKAEKFAELKSSLVKIFPYRETIVKIPITKEGLFSNSIQFDNHVVDSKETTKMFDNGDLCSLKKIIDYVNKDYFENFASRGEDLDSIYGYNSYRGESFKKYNFNERKNILNKVWEYVKATFQSKSLAEIESDFYDPLFVKAKTILNKKSIQKTIEAINAYNDLLVKRDALIKEIYQMSSGEIADAIENGDIKCRHNNDKDKKNNNIKKVLEVSGEKTDVNSPRELESSSDFFFHVTHYERQCELQEKMRISKSVFQANLIDNLAYISKECPKVSIGEQNNNYDKNTGTTSSSSALSIITDGQKKCTELNDNSIIFQHNIGYWFSYSTSDDSEAVQRLKEIKAPMIIDSEGGVSIGGVPTNSEATQNSANLFNFEQIVEAVSKTNEARNEQASLPSILRVVNVDPYLAIESTNEDKVNCTGDQCNADNFTDNYSAQ